MNESIYSFTENPSYHDAIRKIQNTDPVNAETIINPLIEKMLENTQFVKNQQETHCSQKDNPHFVTKGQIGLGNVDNTADINKPISSAVQTALNGKADHSHGTHVSFSPLAPKMNSMASVGTASTVARSDHIHPTDTSRAAVNAPDFTGPISHNRKADTVIGINSTTLGYECIAGCNDSLSAGFQNETKDTIENVGRNVAIGTLNIVDGAQSCAIGLNNHTHERLCSAVGSEIAANALASHGIGYHHILDGVDSVGLGHGCTTAAYSQICVGRGNIRSTLDTDSFIVGKGMGNSEGDLQANCFRVTHTGVFATGNYNSTGADYAELFEWEDGNPDNMDRVGLFVTLDGEKIRPANAEDTFILGIISGNPSVLGDVYDEQWQGMFLTDIYGRPIWEEVTLPAITTKAPDPENPKHLHTVVLYPAHTEWRQKLNPNYDAAQSYKKRTERPEWGCVGMMGKLIVKDDGTCNVNTWARPGVNGVATASHTVTKYRVMSRIDDSHIRVLIL